MRQITQVAKAASITAGRAANVKKRDVADEIRYFRKRVIEDTIRVFCGYGFGDDIEIAASWEEASVIVP